MLSIKTHSIKILNTVKCAECQISRVSYMKKPIMLNVLALTNTLAYYDMATMTVTKSFIAPAPIYNLQFLIEAKKKAPRHSA